MAVTYEQYAREAKRVGDRVLSKTSVYQCLRDDGRFKCRNKTPYKDCECDTCLNNSLIVDALIVAGVKGVVRRISRNILKSYCPVNKEKATGESTCTRKLQFDDDNQVEEEVMTEHNCDCIYCNCKKCGVVQLQQSIIEQNADVDWSEIVTWHQWEKVELDLEQRELMVKNDQANKSEKKDWRKKKIYYDRVRYSGKLSELLTLFTMLVHRLSIHLFNFSWQAHQYEVCKLNL